MLRSSFAPCLGAALILAAGLHADPASERAKIDSLRSQAKSAEAAGKRIEALRLRREADKLEAELAKRSDVTATVKLSAPGMSDEARQRLEANLQKSLEKNFAGRLGPAPGSEGPAFEQQIRSGAHRQQLLDKLASEAREWVSPPHRQYVAGNLLCFKVASLMPQASFQPLPVDRVADAQASLRTVAGYPSKWTQTDGPGTLKRFYAEYIDGPTTAVTTGELTMVVEELSKFALAIALDGLQTLDLGYRSALSRDPQVKAESPEIFAACRQQLEALEKILQTVGNDIGAHQRKLTR